MGTKHYTKQISAFVDQELSKDERQEIAAHLMHCDSCRREHDAVKTGAGIASRLKAADASEQMWSLIEADLDGRGAPAIGMLAAESWFNLRTITAFAGGLVIAALLSLMVYQGWILNPVTDVSRDHTSAVEKPNAPGEIEVPQVNGGAANIDNIENANTSTSPNQIASEAYFRFETLAGTPKVGANSQDAKLAVGDYLETDGLSSARIEVASIGNVEIAPNSRVRLIGTSDREHRLSLERGGIHAKIAAPPRLFIVETPSAMAVDLGCEYTLEVDKAGNSKLKVLTGFVALEQDGRESIVPAGAACMTMKGKGLGTPFSAEVTPEFERALRSFDFENGGSRAVREIIDRAEFYDMITLWHLLSRVSRRDRPVVYDTLARLVSPPVGVTREGVLALNKTMLEKYRAAVETAWFE
jgi:hypothetical protein